MTDERQQSLILALNLFVNLMKKNRILVGIQVDTKNPENSKLAFIDADDSELKNGVSIKPERFNKWFDNE